jgi:hypothetical protein
MKTREFTVEVEGKDVELMVRSPSVQDQKEASKAYNQAFSDAIKARAIVRLKIDEILKEQGLWDDSKQFQLEKLQSEILEKERSLAKGGIPLSRAKEIALEMRKLRLQLRDLISVRTSMDNNTAEGQADNAKFNYLVSVCTVYKENNKPYFSSLQDYLDKSITTVGLQAAQNLANMMYGLDNDYESNLPENKFLKQYHFVDENLRFINKEGKWVDEDGRLVDEEGNYIDKDGNLVDKYGHRVDENGEYIVDAKPFLDDDGNPIIQDENKESEEQTDDNEEQSKKRGRKPKTTQTNTQE